MSRRAVMSRDRALQISDALADAGTSHTVVVFVCDNVMPRERYIVNITPTLTYSATDITALQRLADSLGCGIAYVNGAFAFTEAA
jgi:hypothetical protein